MQKYKIVQPKTPESKLKFELGLFAMQIRASMFVAITPPAADKWLK